MEKVCHLVVNNASSASSFTLADNNEVVSLCLAVLFTWQGKYVTILAQTFFVYSDVLISLEFICLFIYLLTYLFLFFIFLWFF